MSAAPRSVLLFLRTVSLRPFPRPSHLIRHLCITSPPSAMPPTSTPKPTKPPATPSSVADLRIDYSSHPLDQSSLPSSPFQLFSAWLSDAQAAGESEPNAMCLATASSSARPSARMVLLKAWDDAGFVWYTNYQSRKGAHLAENPFAALTFWWPSLERSVRVEGKVMRVSDEESDCYFESRPPKSRLGAWASDQSRPVAGRDVLEGRWSGLLEEHLDQEGGMKKDVKRPPFWGGFRLVPDTIEFWKGREARLHDRIVYERETPEELIPGEDDKLKEEWKTIRLQP